MIARNRRRLSAALVAAAALSLAACSTAEEPAAAPSGAAAEGDCVSVPEESLITPGTLTVVTNASLAPLSYMDGGEIAGLRPEYAELIAGAMCLDFEIINSPFETHIPGLQGGRWDVSATGMVYTEERVEAGIKMVPIEVQGVMIWVPEGNPKNIETAADLGGLRVAVEGPGFESETTQTLSDENVAAGGEPFDILTFTANTEAAQALAAGQADALIATVNPPDDRFEVAGDKLKETVHTLGTVDEPLAEAIAEALVKLNEDGSLKELIDSYEATMYEGEFAVITADNPPQ